MAIVHYHRGYSYTLQYVGTTRYGKSKWMCPVCKRIVTG
jgi:hypothetical protein